MRFREELDGCLAFVFKLFEGCGFVIRLESEEYIEVRVVVYYFSVISAFMNKVFLREIVLLLVVGFRFLMVCMSVWGFFVCGL